MSGRVVFSLTERQAAALLALRNGRQPEFCSGRTGTREQSILFARGLVSVASRGLELTDLGRAAAAVADNLARRSR